MSRITVSAPGKLVLLGDHSVVHNRPCLVVSVDTNLTVSVSQSENEMLTINAPDLGLVNYKKEIDQLSLGNLPKQVEYVEFAVHEFLETSGLHVGVQVDTKSDLDSRFGFGTSGATLAATVAALNELFSTGYSNKQLFEIAFRALHSLKGVGSGVDVASSLNGGILYFVTGGKKIEAVDFGQDLCILAVYSGHKANTVTIVTELMQYRKSHQEEVDDLFDQITRLVESGRLALESNDMSRFGECLNEGHKILQKLRVSTPELDDICNIANKHGALGAKLSGAGGGDCAIIAITKDRVRDFINIFERSGYEAVGVKVALQGAHNVE